MGRQLDIMRNCKHGGMEWPIPAHRQTLRGELLHVVGIVLLVLTLAGCSGGFGGPYDFDGGPQKIANFGFYYSKGIFYSEGIELQKNNIEVFSESVDWYANPGAGESFPHGGQYQRYNYVVDLEGRIVIAVWTDALNLDELRRGPASKCIDGDDGFSIKTVPGRMINFFPEKVYVADGPEIESLLRTKTSPCWLGVPSKGMDDWAGILDALSKHFMLAQYVPARQPIIASYSPVEWVETKVDYGGEIVVNVERDYFWINALSGTYKPDSKFLQKVADHFCEQLGIGPRFTQAWDQEKDRLSELEQVSDKCGDTTIH